MGRVKDDNDKQSTDGFGMSRHSTTTPIRKAGHKSPVYP